MIRIEALARMIGYEKTTIQRWCREGFIPAPVAFDGRAQLWSYAEIVKFCRAKRFVNGYC